jgi:hypothetical protein
MFCVSKQNPLSLQKLQVLIMLYWKSRLWVLMILWIPTVLHAQNNNKIGKDVKDLFTFKKKHCKLQHVYSGVSAGQVVYTEDWGKAIVKNYRIGKKVQIFYRQTQADQTIRTKLVKITKGVKNLVVIVNKFGGDVEQADAKNLKSVTLSQSETKKIMIQSLVLRRKYKWIVRMYPEERANLRYWINKYTVRPYYDPNGDADDTDIPDTEVGDDAGT